VGGGGALYHSFWEIEIGWMRRNTINTVIRYTSGRLYYWYFRAFSVVRLLGDVMRCDAMRCDELHI